MAIPIHSSVIQRVEGMDPDRMRAARLAEADVRDRLFALYAFHAELAKIPELVTEPLIGRMRYQWWRDCVEEIYAGGPVRQHEVSTPLSAVVAQTELPRFHLDRIIDGRERDLDPRPFGSVAEATDYADATSGALLRAAMAVVGMEGGDAAGRAWGLAGLARGYRYYADTMLKAVAFADILVAADQAYGDAKEQYPAEAIPALAYAGLVPGYLKRMRRSGYNPTQDAPDYPAFAKQMRMLAVTMTGRL